MNGVLVAVSNRGGGIARHLQLTEQVLPLSVMDLPDTIGLSVKVRRLRRQLRAESTRVVITHGVAAGLSARLRGRGLRGIRHVEFWHGDPFFTSRPRRASFRVIASAGQPPDVQVFTHEWLAETYGEQRSQIHVLPNAIPVAGAISHRVSGDLRVATYLGRFSPEKGFADLLRAWPRESVDRGWQLIAYGDDPPSFPTPPEGVQVRANTSRPLEVLAQSDLAVIPSWTETGPYVALESVSVGRPFVGTQVGDMPTMVQQAQCGWLCQPRDPASLGEALDRAQRATDAERAAAGARGASWLVTQRPYEAWCRRIQELYAP